MNTNLPRGVYAVTVPFTAFFQVARAGKSYNDARSVYVAAEVEIGDTIISGLCGLFVVRKDGTSHGVRMTLDKDARADHFPVSPKACQTFPVDSLSVAERHEYNPFNPLPDHKGDKSNRLIAPEWVWFKQTHPSVPQPDVAVRYEGLLLNVKLDAAEDRLGLN